MTSSTSPGRSLSPQAAETADRTAPGPCSGIGIGSHSSRRKFVGNAAALALLPVAAAAWPGTAPELPDRKWYEAAAAMSSPTRSAQKCGVLTSLGLAALALLAPSAARAERARSFATDAFSIELPRPVCFAVPVSLRDAGSCKGLPPAGANDIDTTQIGLIAAGGIRRMSGEPAEPGSLPLVGLLQVFQVPASNGKQPEAPQAERVGLDATKAILATLPSEAGRSKVLTRVEDVDGLVTVRTTVDVDDLTPGTRASFFGHIETSTVFSRNATYTVRRAAEE